LAIAIGFGALLDLGLLVSRMWTELFGLAAQTAIWLVLAATWIAAAALSRRWVARLQIGRLRSADDKLSLDWFVQAREEYLKGNWFEAETVLGRLLDRNVLDIEARLLRANLLFRTARKREAASELDRLARAEGSEIWRVEMARLRSRLVEVDGSNAATGTSANDDRKAGSSVAESRELHSEIAPATVAKKAA
jgi:hypothetical protein